MKCFIRKDSVYHSVVKYVLKLIEINRSVSFDFVETHQTADIIFDHDHPKTQPLNLGLYKALGETTPISFDKVLDVSSSESTGNQLFVPGGICCLRFSTW